MEASVTLMNKVMGNLGINATCVSAKVNRHLAFYDIVLESNFKLKKIESLSREIALSLRAMTEPIISFIPSQGIVRIKVANSEADILDFNSLAKRTVTPNGVLPILIGETDSGDPLWVDFAKNPHTLVAGTTGSGKSTLLHVLIENCLRRNDVFLYLVDPKNGVEFGCYEKEKKTSVFVNYEQTINLLEHLVSEMESRFKELKRLGLKSIDENPRIFQKHFVVIDEVAELLMLDGVKNNPNFGKFEFMIIQLAQKARAAGIYLVCATQRPSADVLKGNIKANFPARISCKVSSSTDSKVILDTVGAETLLGKGDAILNNSANGNVRFQVAYIKR